MTLSASQLSALAAALCIVAAGCRAAPEAAGADLEAAADAGADGAVDAALGAADAGSAVDAAAADDSSGETAASDTGASDAGIGAPASAAIQLAGQPTAGKGKTAPFTFDIPPGTVAFALNATAEPNVYLTFEALTDPDGVVLIDDGWIEKDTVTGGQICALCKIRVAPQQGAAAALVPNAPDIAVKPGTWSARARAWTQTQSGTFAPPKKASWPGVIGLSLALQQGAAPPLASTLDVNLFWSGAEGLSAATAPTDARVVAWLSRLGDLYAQVSLGLGVVRHYDLPAGFEVVEALDPTNADFAALGAATAQAPPGLAFAMVREIASPFGGAGAVLGVSGGIPGPVLLPGAPRTVVVVSLADLPGGFGRPPAPHDVGLTMAHEGGHYLGLFHTSENDFGGFGPKLSDPLPDTPAMDAANLMHFDGGAQGSKLSPQQGAVLRANPVTAPLAPGGTP